MNTCINCRGTTRRSMSWTSKFQRCNSPWPSVVQLETTIAPGSASIVHAATLATNAWFDSVAFVNQWVLDATVGDGDDDDKIVLNGTKGALSTTSCLDVEFPFTVRKGGVG